MAALTATPLARSGALAADVLTISTGERADSAPCVTSTGVAQRTISFPPNDTGGSKVADDRRT